MPHQPVEVVRARGARIHLVVGHLRLLAEVLPQLLRHARRLLQRGAVRHVDDHLELALVVEGQHLDLDQLERHQRAGEQQEHNHAAEEYPAPLSVGDQRVHDPAIQPRGPAFGLVFMVIAGCVVPQQAQRRPRRDHEGHDQRKQHGGRRAHRDRPHVWTHQSADEGHGQNGGDDGEGRQNRGIADFVHRFDGDFGEWAPAARWQAEMAHDVFHHHDGVVHQNADGKDQREQRHPVQRVAEEVEDEQRERQGHRNRDQHHAGFAPAQRQRDQQRDRKRRDEQVLQQFVGLVLRGLAIVAGDGDVQVGRQQISAQLFDFLLGLFGDDGRVRALALGQRDGHRRILAAHGVIRRSGGVGVQNVILRLRRPIHDFRRHIAQVHRLALIYADHDLLQIVGLAQKTSGLDLELLIALREASGQAARIGLLQLRGDRARRHPVSRQPLGVEHHPHLARQSADDLGLRNIVNLLELVLQFAGNLPQPVAVVVLAPQRQRHDGHVIDGAHFDERRRNSLRNAVEVGVQLVVRLDDGVFFLGADVETHHQHAHAGVRDGVHVLDARNFAQQPLPWGRSRAAPLPPVKLRASARKRRAWER